MSDVDLPDDLRQRLVRAAELSGRPASVLAQEAIAAYLDDLEDLQVAERRLDDIRAGRTHPVPLTEVMRRLGTDDGKG